MIKTFFEIEIILIFFPNLKDFKIKNVQISREYINNVLFNKKKLLIFKMNIIFLVKNIEFQKKSI